MAWSCGLVPRGHPQGPCCEGPTIDKDGNPRVLAAAVFQEPTTQPALSVNPRDTWLWFLRHSDKEDRGKDRKSKVSRGAPACMCECTCGSSLNPQAATLTPTPLAGPPAHPDHFTKHRPSPLAWGQRAQEVSS